LRRRGVMSWPTIGGASIMCVGLGKSLKSVTFQKVQSLLKYQS
jgi:hypothetical protein